MEMHRMLSSLHGLVDSSAILAIYGADRAELELLALVHEMTSAPTGDTHG